MPSGSDIAWSTFSRATNKHTGANLNGAPFKLAASEYGETLMWSLGGNYRSATRFDDSFHCCGVGSMVTELYLNENRVYTSPEMKSPYYPTGIVIAKAEAEALFPTADRRIVRRDLSSMSTRSSCPQPAAFNSRAQYVAMGKGSYIWMSFDAVSQRDFATARIYLCIVGEP